MSAQPPGAPETTQFAVLIFTDICDSTGLKAKHGALAYKLAAELHNELFEKIAAEEKLTLIKNTGDGYFARTTSVAAAVRFALRFQHGMRGAAWPGFALVTRVGIHAGEVADITTLGQSDVLAPAADLVARVMSLAAGGQILLTRGPFDEARHFVRAHPQVSDGAEPPDLAWLAHGPYLFKGCEEPVEVFEVGAEGRAPLTAPPDGEKAKRAIRPGEEVTLGWRPAVGLEVPGRVGWDLTRKIGEGGFGEVWLAEHAKLKQRRVFKFCFDDERLRSFKRELTFFRLIRDALGERDDIARLYDVKLDEPPFFLESEFAERGNLVEWAEREGGLATIPLPRRLDIAARIADAVAAAHSIGILHKDLKPQNVLMQARKSGEVFPQLTDFGIGALTDKGALDAHAITAAGFTVNTLLSSSSGSGMTRLYAPPEQLTGKAYTVQGDVYALGVVLYQLVVGDFARALAPGWEREVQDPLLREDIAGCVDGDPAHRFPSAAEVAERLRSLEERRAEQATKAQQTRLEEELAAAEARAALNRERWKRTRRIAAVVGVLAVAAICASLYAAWQAMRAKAAENLASERQEHAARARDAAESLITEAIHGLRVKLLAVGKVDVMEDMVKAAEAYYRRLPAELANDETERHLASLALNRALIAGALGQDAAYEQHTREALRIVDDLSKRFPADQKLHDEACLAMLNLCQLYADRTESEKVVETADAIVARCDAWLATHPESISSMKHKALAHGAAAQALIRNLGNPQEGSKRFQTVAEIAKRMREAGGESAAVLEVEGCIHYGKANAAGKMKLMDLEISEFEAATASFARALELGGDSALLRELHVGAMHHAGKHAMERAKLAGDQEGIKRAEALMKQALEGRKRLVELEPGRAEWWRDLGHSYHTFGRGVMQSDPKAAISHFEESLRCWGEAIKRHPTRAQLVRERGQAATDLAATILRSEAPDYPRAAGALAQCIDDWARSLEMSNFSPAMNREVKWDVDRMNRVADAAPAAAVPFMIKARERLEAMLPKVTGKSDVPQAHATLLTGLKKAFQRLDQASEAAEVEKALTRNPYFADKNAQKAEGRASELLSEILKAPKDKKAGLLAAFDQFFRETTAALEETSKHLTPHRHARARGAVARAYGDALLEAKAYPRAEELLREAAQFHGRARDVAPDEVEEGEMKWALLVSQAGLGRAMAANGRKAEGLKLEGEALAEMDALARATQSPDRLREAGTLWRHFSFRLPAEADAEITAALGKAVLNGRESTRLAMADPEASPEAKAWPMTEAAYSAHHLGLHARRLKRGTEAEDAFQEALSLSEEAARLYPRPSKTHQEANIRYDYARTLIENGRTDAGQKQIELMEAAIRAAWDKGVTEPSLLRQVDGWLKDLRALIPKP